METLQRQMQAQQRLLMALQQGKLDDMMRRIAVAGRAANTQSSSTVTVESSETAEKAASSSSMSATTKEKGAASKKDGNDNYGVSQPGDADDILVEPAPTTSRDKVCCICLTKCPIDELSGHLLRHMELFAGASVCPFCAWDAGSHRKMTDHFLLKHGNVEKIPCDFPDCQRAFWTAREMTRHKNNHN